MGNYLNMLHVSAENVRLGIGIDSVQSDSESDLDLVDSSSLISKQV